MISPFLMKTSEIEKEWKSRGFSFAVWEDPPGKQDLE